MTEKISQRLTVAMYRHGLITEDEQDIYAYTLLVMTEQLFAMILTTVTAVMTGSVIYVFTFTGTFFLLRKSSGGYHCNTYPGCLFLSAVTLIPSVLAPLFSGFVMPWYLLTVFASAIFIICTGSVNHPSMDWSSEEWFAASRATRRTLLAILAVIILLLSANIGYEIIFCLSRGIVLDAVSILLAKIFRQEVRPNEH